MGLNSYLRCLTSPYRSMVFYVCNFPRTSFKKREGLEAMWKNTNRTACYMCNICVFCFLHKRNNLDCKTTQFQIALLLGNSKIEHGDGVLSRHQILVNSHYLMSNVDFVTKQKQHWTFTILFCTGYFCFYSSA